MKSLTNLIALLLFPLISYAQITCCGDHIIYGNENENFPRKTKVIDGSLYMIAQENIEDQRFSTFSKFDLEGTLIWQTRIENEAEYLDFTQTDEPTQSFLLVGRTPIINPNGGFLDNQSLITKIDDSGNLIFNQSYDNTGREQFTRIIKHPFPLDTLFPFYLSGIHNPGAPSTLDDYTIINLDADANINWAREYENNDDDQWAASLTAMPNGNIISSGVTFQEPSGNILEFDGLSGDLTRSLTTSNATLSFDRSLRLSSGQILFYGFFGNSGNISDFRGMISLFSSDLEFQDAIEFNGIISTRTIDAVQVADNRVIISNVHAVGQPSIISLEIDSILNITDRKTLNNGGPDFSNPSLTTDGERFYFTDGRRLETESFGDLDISIANFATDLSDACLSDTTIIYFRRSLEISDHPIIEEAFTMAMPEDYGLAIQDSLETSIACMSSIEICDNDIDDDGDGLTDCDDPDLANDCCCLPPDMFNLPDSISICLGDTIILDAGPGFSSYFWFDSEVFIDSSQTVFVSNPDSYIAGALDSCENLVLDTVVVSLILEEVITETIMENLCDGDTLIINNEAFTEGGIFEQTFVSSVGCDSTLIIQIELLDLPPSELLSVDLCIGDTIIINGEAFSEEGSFTQFLESENGCDSILVVEINESEVFGTDIVESICPGDSVIINNEVFTEEGSFVQNLVSEAGCDSILNINIVELEAMSIDTLASICEGDSAFIAGVFYDTAGTFVDFLDIGLECPLVVNITIESFPAITIDTSFQLCQGDTLNFFGVDYTEGGSFIQEVESIGCDTTFNLEIEELESFFISESFFLFSGDTLVINGEEFTEGGIFENNFTTVDGCDSIVSITVNEIGALVEYDMNDCASFLGGEDRIYDEFTPAFPDSLACSNIGASNLSRINPMVNSHSCTPGIGDTPAICFSSLDNCTFEGDSDQALRFSVTVESDGSQNVNLVAMSLYQQAPETFDWIAGPEGVNNYPTLYGVRILRNGEEIVRLEDMPTSLEWQRDTIFFDTSLTPFTVADSATFDIEVLGYCLSGQDSDVSAFDLDNLRMFGVCLDDVPNNRTIGGTVQNPLTGESIIDASLRLHNGELIASTETNSDGSFAFEEIPYYQNIQLISSKDGDDLFGVSTLDLLHIKNHILGLQAFETAQQQIAADVNNDQKISAIDLIELRKLILGIYVEIPHQDSWTFYNAALEMDPSNPFNYLDVIPISNQITGDLNVEFGGIKIGDVNGSYTNSFGNHIADNRSEPIQFTWNQTGDLINVYAAEVNELHGLQMQFSIDRIIPGQLVPALLPLESYHFNIDPQGIVSISFDSDLGIDLKKGELLFSLQVESLATDIQTNIGGLENEIYTGKTLLSTPITLRSEKIQINTPSLSDMSVYPNPFVNHAMLSFKASQEGQLDLEIVDLLGRQINQQKVSVSSGDNQLEISTETLRTKGTYLLIINFEGNRYYQKLIFGN